MGLKGKKWLRTFSSEIFCPRNKDSDIRGSPFAVKLKPEKAKAQLAFRKTGEEKSTARGTTDTESGR